MTAPNTAALNASRPPLNVITSLSAPAHAQPVQAQQQQARIIHGSPPNDQLEQMAQEVKRLNAVVTQMARQISTLSSIVNSLQAPAQPAYPRDPAPVQFSMVFNMGVPAPQAQGLHQPLVTIASIMAWHWQTTAQLFAAETQRGAVMAPPIPAVPPPVAQQPEAIRAEPGGTPPSAVQPNPAPPQQIKPAPIRGGPNRARPRTTTSAPERALDLSRPHPRALAPQPGFTRAELKAELHTLDDLEDGPASLSFLNQQIRKRKLEEDNRAIRANTPAPQEVHDAMHAQDHHPDLEAVYTRLINELELTQKNTNAGSHAAAPANTSTEAQSAELKSQPGTPRARLPHVLMDDEQRATVDAAFQRSAQAAQTLATQLQDQFADPQTLPRKK